MERRQLSADSLLLLAAAIWGFAFVAQRAGMEHLGPFAFNALRFGLGTLVLATVLALRRDSLLGFRARAGRVMPEDAGRDAASASEEGQHASALVTGSFCAGLLLFAGSSFQQTGLVTTTAGKGGFITGLYVILVPLLGLARGLRPGGGTRLGAILALAGLYLLSLKGSVGLVAGDALVFAGACFWALHVLMIDHLTRRHDPLRIALVQFATCALLSLVFAAVFETTSVAKVRAACLPLLYSGLFSVGVAFTLQVVAQRRAPAAHAAILLSLEAVFAALGGWLLLDESLGTRGLTGCALMLAGMLASQIGRPKKARA